MRVTGKNFRFPGIRRYMVGENSVNEIDIPCDVNDKAAGDTPQDGEFHIFFYCFLLQLFK